MLKIHNSLSRKKEPFTPIEPGKVRMYVCGMTVYDYCHLGHARVMVVFDMVTRWLRASRYDVTYVRNITDIDDKIIKRAVERGISIRALTDEMIAAMREDIGAIGVLPPTHEPRATDYVPQMVSLIGQLEAKGLAYRAVDGDVVELALERAELLIHRVDLGALGEGDVVERAVGEQTTAHRRLGHVDVEKANPRVRLVDQLAPVPVVPANRGFSGWRRFAVLPVSHSDRCSSQAVLQLLTNVPLHK